MHCEHTGIQIYLRQYGIAIRGDYFKCEDVHIFRVNNTSMQHSGRVGGLDSIYDVFHGVVTEVDAWFDEDAKIGTIIARPDAFNYYGFEGKPKEKVLPSL